MGKPSKQNLRSRIKNHYRGNAESSTLRLTLGFLLSEKLGIELRRVGSGKRMTFSQGEKVLSARARQARIKLIESLNESRDDVYQAAYAFNLLQDANRYVSKLEYDGWLEKWGHLEHLLGYERRIDGLQLRARIAV
jgi:hypothetical protein